MIGDRKGGWVGSSNTPAAAVFKQWAAERFGASISYHGGVSGAAERVAEDVQRTLRAGGRAREELYKLLDAEYAFHQYFLRRLYGWDDISLRRGMSSAEYASNYKSGRFTANALVSFSEGSGFSGKRIEVIVGIGRVLKTWYQGSVYLIPSEREFILIGGVYRALSVR